MNNPRRIQRHLVKALAAGAVLVAAALPMAIASVAGAADSVSSVAFNTTASGGTTTTNAYFGTGASGTFSIVGAFAGDGETTATVTTTAPGVTFTGVTDPAGGTAITGSFASTSATTPGSYPITVTDNNGTGTLDAAFTVNAAPTVSSVSPTGMADTTANTPATVTLTGAGFVGTPKVYLTSTVDGTKLTGVTVTASGGTIATPVSTLTVSVTPENLVNSAPATPGTYTFTVVNPDGGQIASAALFTVTG